LFMLKLLVNFFGGAAVFVLEVVGAAVLLPALLVDPSLGAGSKSAEMAVEMVGIEAGGAEEDGLASEGADAEVGGAAADALSLEGGLSPGEPLSAAVDATSGAASELVSTFSCCWDGVGPATSGSTSAAVVRSLARGASSDAALSRASKPWDVVDSC
jgi:hypothetical protein